MTAKQEVSGYIVEDFKRHAKKSGLYYAGSDEPLKVFLFLSCLPPFPPFRRLQLYLCFVILIEE